MALSNSVNTLCPRSDQVDRQGVFNNLVLHLHPRTVPAQTLDLTLTWGLGGMALVLIALLVFTGILLMVVYEPSPGKAYDAIVTIKEHVWFGQWVRNIHYWSGNTLVVVVFLHMLRVFFTGAFHPPRRSNWIIGVCLFFLVLAANFTGYLLPWDQLAYWAITICTGMLEYIPGVGIWMQKTIRGGTEIGPATLLIFYTVHATIVPACLFVIMPFHFWRVRKAGGVVIVPSAVENPDGQPAYVETIPNLVLRELVVALVLIAFILVFSTLFNAPLEARANPGMSPNPAKAPWYFLGIQELLLHFHPVFAVVVIPLLVTAALILFPYLPYHSDTAGLWFCSRKGRRTGFVAILTGFMVTPLAIISDEFLIDFRAAMSGVAPVISDGLIPATLVLGYLVAFYVFIKRKYAASNSEATQALFILLLATYIILTATGTWFRGPGMALTWPWGGPG